MSATTLPTSSNPKDSKIEKTPKQDDDYWRDGWSNGEERSSAPIPEPPPRIRRRNGGMPTGGILD